MPSSTHHMPLTATMTLLRRVTDSFAPAFYCCSLSLGDEDTQRLLRQTLHTPRRYNEAFDARALLGHPRTHDSTPASGAAACWGRGQRVNRFSTMPWSKLSSFDPDLSFPPSPDAPLPDQLGSGTEERRMA